MKRVHLQAVQSSWPLAGRENPRSGPDFDIHLHFDGARQIQAVCFEAFFNGRFFLSLSPGHNPECGPDKVTFVHRASDSLYLRLLACLGACFLLGPLMRSVKPGCPFQPFVLATQFAPRRRISCQFKSQTKCLSPT